MKKRKQKIRESLYSIKKSMKRILNRIKQWLCSCPYYIRRFMTRLIVRNRRFTIISNNCWAGKVYQYLGMQYLTPTVGLYFFAEDYLKFVRNLRYYLTTELTFISMEESKYHDELTKRKRDVIVGKLDDVEIIFLHYKTKAEAKEKWERRAARVNYDHIILKFSNMNLCTEEHLREFDALPFENKWMLNIRKEPKYPCEIYWAGPNNGTEILLDTDPFPGNLKIFRLLNRKPRKYPIDGYDVQK